MAIGHPIDHQADHIANVIAGGVEGQGCCLGCGCVAGIQVKDGGIVHRRNSHRAGGDVAACIGGTAVVDLEGNGAVSGAGVVAAVGVRNGAQCGLELGDGGGSARRGQGKDTVGAVVAAGDIPEGRGVGIAESQHVL